MFTIAEKTAIEIFISIYPNNLHFDEILVRLEHNEVDVIPSPFLAHLCRIELSQLIEEARDKIQAILRIK